MKTVEYHAIIAARIVSLVNADSMKCLAGNAFVPVKAAATSSPRRLDNDAPLLDLALHPVGGGVDCTGGGVCAVEGDMRGGGEVFPIQEVTGADVAFGGDMSKLLPRYEDIPKEFKGFHNSNKWNKLVSTWFFRGIKNCQWKPKEDIDADKALAHLKAIMCSWEPKHEHKEAGVAYLLSQWFDDVIYEPAK